MQTWTIGETTITAVIEAEGPTRGTFLFRGADEAAVLAEHQWAIPDFVTEAGRLLTRVQALCINTGSKRIVVDTCVGNDKIRTNRFWNQLSTPFLASLIEAGFDRHDVDIVVCTHLHIDHVGWNTMLVGGDWVPTFPNAEHIFVDTEFAHWNAEMVANDGADQDGDTVHADSVVPVVDAGLAKLVPTDYEVVEGITLTPTPGHTPGHVSVAITSGDDKAIITGDMMHHAVQVATPHWRSRFDIDGDAAEATRRDFLAEYADSDWLVIGTHFGGPCAGHIVSTDQGFEFRAQTLRQESA